MRIRTGYSFRSAVGKLPDVMEAIKVSGMPFAPITDRGSIFGYVKWMKLCKENGIKPVFGIELAVSENPQAKKPIMDHWTFIAKTDIVPIFDLLEIATNQFRYESVLTYEQAMAEDCIKIIGHVTNLEAIDPKTPDIYVGLSPSLSVAQFRKAQSLWFKFIACSDNKYPKLGDEGLYEVICGRGASIQTYPQHILDEAEWRLSLARVVQETDKDEAWANALSAGKISSATLKTGQMLIPEKLKSLREMCIEGAEKLGCDLTKPEYLARMDRELGLIADKEFEDYFYIISDLVKWARERMIVGPARGSSCGSLVCYLLEITSIDPLPYGLIFERFIDINRYDLPDIDIDFSDQKRAMVFEYMEEKYGRDHVARLGTVAMYQPRSAMKEAGAALGVPRWKCEKALDSLIERSVGDSRALDTLEDTLRMTPNGKDLLRDYPEILVATKMEGHPRHAGQHAAGILLTQEPVKKYIGIDSRTGATQCDKKDAETLDLLKIDALGLTQLAIFEDTLEMCGFPHDHLEKVPLDDDEAFGVLNRFHFSGIFQFQGITLQSLSRQTVITELDDIIAITALGRPGPLASGGAAEWIMRKNGKRKIEYPHPLFEPYLEDTRGVVLYQEQVMEICRQIGDLSWGDVTALRKAMSKSLGKEYFDQFGDKFKSAAVKKGIPADVLEKVWDDLCAYGSWAFNKSHSVAYGVISYWCCWLKAHHPVEFAAATLQHETDPTKQIKILREMAEEGIGYVAVDAELSTGVWRAGVIDGERVLIGPVQNVKGIGPKLAQQIVSARARNENLPDRAMKLLANPVTPIDSLWPITDRISEIMPDPTDRNIWTPPTKIGDIDESHKHDQSFVIIATAKTISPRDENETITIARRGYEIKSGPTATLNLQMEDDTGIIYCKIGRWKYNEMGRGVVERGRPEKAIYAIKGSAMAGRRFLLVNNVRYIGDMDPKYKEDA